MKILTCIYFLLQTQLINPDTLIMQNSIGTNSVKVETLRVIVQEKTTGSNKYFDLIGSIQKSINEFNLYIWKLLLVLLLVFLMSYLNYRINILYNKYNFSKRFKNADLLKVALHVLVWVLTISLIFSLVLKSSIFLFLLFLIFIVIVSIISFSDLAKNIIGGLLILLDKPFEYGDWIKIGNYSGKVRAKNLRTTEIISEDDSLITIPNYYFITNAFENLNIISKNKKVSFVVEVSPRSDISKIKSSLSEIVSLSIYNSINRPVEIVYKGLNDRGKLEFQIKAYVFDAKYESEFKSDVQESIAEIFGID